MKSTLGFALALLALGQIKQTKQAQIAQDRHLIVGAWSLTSYELRMKPSGRDHDALWATPGRPNPLRGERPDVGPAHASRNYRLRQQ